MQAFHSRIARFYLPYRNIARTLFGSHTAGVKDTFDSIPGPPRIPLFGNLYMFTRFGPYSFDKLYEAYYDLYQKYGPVVRLDLGISMLALFDPDDISSILDLGDAYPDRPLLGALRHYRHKNKSKYSSGGLAGENGEEWKRLRKATNFMMDPKFSEFYLPAQEEIAADFVSRIKRIRDSKGVVKDFLHEIYRFTEESIGIVCFGLRLGVLDKSKSDTKWSSKVTQASEDNLQALSDTILGFPWWKIFNTEPYKKLVAAQDFFHDFAAECMAKADLKLKDPSKSNDPTLQFYKTLCENPALSPQDVALLMVEVFAAGIDATGNSICYILYNLAKNPDAQEKVYNEIEHLAPSSQSVTKSAMDKMKFLKACIKESHRLTPTSGGTARILKSETRISGYLVPANVICIGINPLICRDPQYFPDPLQFKPERWLKDGDADPASKPHPYCVLPFSHGARRCVGQRFAEQEIQICIIKIIQKYRIKFEGPDLGVKMRMLLIPDRPVNLIFEDRHPN